ncbi:unnamed protein product [Withania somnifera]
MPAAFMDPQESDQETFIEVTDLTIDPSIDKPKLLLNKEKQISVDPISLKESDELAIPCPIPKLLNIPKKISSFSLPNSTTSSPAFAKKNKYYKNQINQLPSSLSSTNHLARQHSVGLTDLEQMKEIHLRRSKSCGEGRASAPPEEFDIWFTPKSTRQHVPAAGDNDKKLINKNSFSDESEVGSRNDEIYNRKTLEARNQDEEKFKCGALCLFIPGLGKGIKHVKTGRRQVSGVSSSDIGPHVVSRTVSLEKFKCGSWTSSAAIINDVGDSVSNSFFRSANGAYPESSKTQQQIATPRKSHDSTRHVRFSTSSPTSPTSCITPRILRARVDFTTFLEAQSA